MQIKIQNELKQNEEAKSDKELDEKTPEKSQIFNNS